VTFTPPTKRTTGQCSEACAAFRSAQQTSPVPLPGHLAGCPALYPLQPQPGDEPDTLTKAIRTVRSLHSFANHDRADSLLEEAINLISEAASERKALKERLKAYEDTQRYASDSNARYLKMGQQQGRVALATELLSAPWATLEDAREYLNTLIADDAES
jgi:hypothetical protein